jgi:dihydroorotase
VQNGTFGFTDTNGARMMGKQNIVADVTMKGGRVYWDLNGRFRPLWNTLDKAYKAQGDPLWDGTISATVRNRK